jgi:putative nucleotidyltransferase with HDIG domain
MDNYKDLVSSTLELPSPPVVVQRLQKVFSREEISGHDIARVIETDQSFTARVLRLVNSPFYGFTRKIVSVEEAITMLGINAIKQLILATSLLNTFKTGKQTSALTNFWSHSLGVAIIAKHLAYRFDKDTQSEIFLGGILHDIGRLFFLKFEPERFDQFYVGQESVTGIDSEAAFFGIDHQKIGEMLARKWNFPKSICAIIEYHHRPLESVDHVQMVATINMADIICHGFDLGRSGNFYISDFYPEVWKTVNLSYAELEKRLEIALTEFENSEKAFLELN